MLRYVIRADSDHVTLCTFDKNFDLDFIMITVEF